MLTAISNVAAVYDEIIFNSVNKETTQGVKYFNK